MTVAVRIITYNVTSYLAENKALKYL